MEDCVRIIDIEADNFYIAACIMDLEARYEWCFIGVYASPKDGIRKMQWKDLERKINGWGEKWIMAGDFNDIVSNDDKWGGRLRLEGSFQEFRNFLKKH